jgi:hypothetical protein
MRKRSIVEQEEVQVAYLFILNYRFPFITHNVYVRQYELNIYEGENSCSIAWSLTRGGNIKFIKFFLLILKRNKNINLIQL